MLAVSPSPLRRNSNKDDDEISHCQGEMAEQDKYFSSIGVGGDDDGGGGFAAELSEGSLLESINFDDLFAGIDVLPDLEMDTELFAAAEFSLSDESDELASSSVVTVVNSKLPDGIIDGGVGNKSDEQGNNSASSSDSDSGANSGSSSKGEEIVSKRDDQPVVLNPSPNNNNNNNNNKESDNQKGRKSSSSSSSSKNHPAQGKKKVKKVDWTPELHRRFVQAVEHLGVDKAVPSRILEVMGIDCLTRHNIASHLQKYRSHRKHLLAREAEAASWSQRRQMFGGARGGGGGGGGGKREVTPWVAPTIGFPPMTPPPPPVPPPMPPHHHFRPLHVWGHPTMDQSLIHIWPKPSPSPLPPPPNWAAPSSHSSDPSYWQHINQPHHQRAPNALTPGAQCFPQPPLTTTRFGSPRTVPGIPPPHAIYKLDPGIAIPPRQSPAPRPLFDFHPSKESVDAAIGDVLTKPWLPLPLGLKAPALESVMGELQRQGIPKVPPSCA